MSKSPCYSSKGPAELLSVAGFMPCYHIAIIWTASSDAALLACSKATARWENAQAVTEWNVEVRFLLSFISCIRGLERSGWKY
jgi:hypothetical protein